MLKLISDDVEVIVKPNHPAYKLLSKFKWETVSIQPLNDEPTTPLEAPVSHENTPPVEDVVPDPEPEHGEPEDAKEYNHRVIHKISNLSLLPSSTMDINFYELTVTNPMTIMLSSLAELFSCDVERLLLGEIIIEVEVVGINSNASMWTVQNANGYKYAVSGEHFL